MACDIISEYNGSIFSDLIKLGYPAARIRLLVKIICGNMSIYCNNCNLSVHLTMVKMIIDSYIEQKKSKHSNRDRIKHLNREITY